MKKLGYALFKLNLTFFLCCKYREQISVDCFSFVNPVCGMLGSRDLIEMLTTFYLRSMSSTTSHFGHILFDDHDILFSNRYLIYPSISFLPWESVVVVPGGSVATTKLSLLLEFEHSRDLWNMSLVTNLLQAAFSSLI